MSRSADEIGEVLMQRERIPFAASCRYDETLVAEIEAAQAPAIVACALHVWNDDLGQAHRLAQQLEGDSSADYWHAIIHRREGDFSNAQYWFRRVGPHPVVRAVYGDDPQAPIAFVDRCRRAGSDDDSELESLQRREMALLFAHVSAAVSGV